MPIGKQEAEAAIKAISKSLFENIKNNQHTMEKHFNKTKAKDAAGENHPQGYFKKQNKNYITKSSDIKKFSTNKKNELYKSMGIKARDFAKAHKEAMDRYDTISITTTSAAQEQDILPIVTRVLDKCALYAANDPSRFLAVAPVPDGFVGRSIEVDGTKHRDCDYAVVVVSAAAGGNPQIVTVFPANEQYVKRNSLLV